MTTDDDLTVSDTRGPCENTFLARVTPEQRANLAGFPADATIRCARQAEHEGACVGSLSWATVSGVPAVLAASWFPL